LERALRPVWWFLASPPTQWRVSVFRSKSLMTLKMSLPPNQSENPCGSWSSGEHVWIGCPTHLFTLPPHRRLLLAQSNRLVVLALAIPGANLFSGVLLPSQWFQERRVQKNETLCWLLGTSVRKTRRFLRTDVPSSQHRCYSFEASCAFAALTSLSGVNPNFCCNALSGAEAPKVRIPMTVPFRPV
jgi:hypothetical protein